jgi:hypothetical protein
MLAVAECLIRKDDFGYKPGRTRRALEHLVGDAVWGDYSQMSERFGKGVRWRKECRVLICE